MKNQTIAVGICTLALLTGAWLATAQPGQPAGKKGADQAREKEEGDEIAIKLADAPEPVRKAAAKLTSADKVTQVTKEEGQKNVYIYEVEYTDGGVACSADVSAAGDILELEKSVDAGALPGPATAALQKEYPGATFKGHVLVQKFVYELDVVKDGKGHQIEVDAAGNIEDAARSKDADGDNDQEKDEENEGK